MRKIGKIFFAFMLLFLMSTVKASGEVWLDLKILDEVQLVDGTTWYVAKDSDSTSENVLLVSAYNVSEDFKYDARTDYVVPFNETDYLNTLYGDSSIRKIIDEGFAPVLYENLNSNFKYNDGVMKIVVDEIGIIGSNDFVRIIKAFNYEFAMNTMTNIKNVGESVYIGPEWLQRETFWMAEDGWYSKPYTTMGLNAGYVKKASNMSTEKYGIRPYIIISKKYINGQYKITYSKEVVLEYEKDLYNENEVINFSLEDGYEYFDLSVKVNDSEIDPIDNYDYTFVMPAMDTEIEVSYSSRKPINYNIDYVLDGGVVGKENPTSYTVISDTIVLNNPVKEGYKFIGWSAEGSEELYEKMTIEPGSIGNLKFIAHYEKVEENPNTSVFKNIAIILTGIVVSGGMLLFIKKKDFR